MVSCSYKIRRLNQTLLASLLGVIEGLTEFLPVSSTAHLRIFEALAGVRLEDGYWKMFSIVIQLGAILCLPFYFVDRIAGIIRTFPGGTRGRNSVMTHPISLTLIAFLFTAAPSYALSKMIGDNLESLRVMGWALIAGGVVMFVVDALFGDGMGGSSVIQELESMSPVRAIFIGLMQTLAAVFPGTSRSMATIAAGQMTGLSRPAALEFSFLLSMPTMAAAVAYDLVKTIRSGEAHVGVGGWFTLALGFVISFAVAYAVVAWFMHWVRQHGFLPFVVYRIAAGIAVLVFLA